MASIRCPACQHEVTLPSDPAHSGKPVRCSWCANMIPTAPDSARPPLPDTVKMTVEQIQRLAGKPSPPSAAP